MHFNSKKPDIDVIPLAAFYFNLKFKLFFFFNDRIKKRAPCCSRCMTGSKTSSLLFTPSSLLFKPSSLLFTPPVWQDQNNKLLSCSERLKIVIAVNSYLNTEAFDPLLESENNQGKLFWHISFAFDAFFDKILIFLNNWWNKIVIILFFFQSRANNWCQAARVPRNDKITKNGV